MIIRKEQGFSITAIIAVLLTVAVLGLIGWKMYSLYGKPTTTTETNQSNSQTTTTTQEQTDPNAGYVVIKEWGVRFKPVDGLTDVIYAFSPTTQTINFSTNSLKALDSNCAPDKAPAIGGIERTTTPYNSPHPQALGAINGYYYYYDSQQSTCSDTKSIQDTETQQIALLKQSVILLEAAK
jgi:hypothetical protein